VVPNDVDKTAKAIEEFLRPFIRNSEEPPEYTVVAQALICENYKLVHRLLKDDGGVSLLLPEDTIDVEAYLNRHLNNHQDLSSMQLAGKHEQVAELVAKAVKPIHGSTKRNVIVGFSMRGSGKTQLLKRFVRIFIGNEMAHPGVVLVRCLDRAAKAPWMLELLSPTRRVDVCQKALCLLIQDHLEDLGLVRQGQVVFSDVGSAYSEWMRLTKSRYVVIALDTCEVLADQAGFSTHSDGTRYTLLEEFCLSIPSPHAIVCVGCNASIKQTDFVLTKANVTPLDPLEPIPQIELATTLTSWKVTSDVAMQLPFHELTGGVPRVLRSACGWSYQGFLLQKPGNSYISGFDSWVGRVHDLYPVVDKAPRTVLYHLYLQSCTKWPLTKNPMELAVLPGEMTYATAIKKSLCTIRKVPEEDRYFVATSPIVLCGQLGTSEKWPVQPKDLLSLDSYKAVLQGGALDTGVPFERLFMFSLMARYTLASPVGKWVRLSTVLAGAVHPADVAEAEKYEVCCTALECGNVVYSEAEERARSDTGLLLWNGGNATAHHDGYIACRTGTKSGVMAINCRCGHPKTPSELFTKTAQQLHSKERTLLHKTWSLGDEGHISFPLLVVTNKKNNDEAMNLYAGRVIRMTASEMSICEWLGVHKSDTKVRYTQVL